MKIVFFSLILAISTFLNASIVVGNVVSVEGSVKVKSEGSFKKSNVKTGLQVKAGDLISTSRKGRTVIKLTDGSSVVLDIKSSVLFASNNAIEQQAGKVYYKITSRNAKNSLKVKTPFAIIGIKGTTFVINAQDKQESVALKEGLIGVSSVKAEFTLYRKELLAAYKNYVDDQMSEFEKFKNGIKRPEPIVTKEFDLDAGNSVSFARNVAKESRLDESNDLEFDRFEMMIKAAQ